MYHAVGGRAHQKSTSEKMSVDSTQNWPPQLTLKLSTRCLKKCIQSYSSVTSSG